MFTRPQAEQEKEAEQLAREQRRKKRKRSDCEREADEEEEEEEEEEDGDGDLAEESEEVFQLRERLDENGEEGDSDAEREDNAVEGDDKAVSSVSQSTDEAVNPLSPFRWGSSTGPNSQICFFGFSFICELIVVFSSSFPQGFFEEAPLPLSDVNFSDMNLSRPLLKVALNWNHSLALPFVPLFI